jgi:hypothetical protein
MAHPLHIHTYIHTYIAVMMMEAEPVSEMGMKKKLSTVDIIQNHVYYNHIRKRSDILT